MKELTTEQKAQRYDKSVERAKGVIEQNPLMEYLKKGIEYIFPKLKESEDEKISKSIIDLINRLHKGCAIILSDEEKDAQIAWLEKQGKKKSIDVYPIFRVGNHIRNKKTGDTVLIEQIDVKEKCYEYSSHDDAAKIYSDFSWEKQNEWELIGQEIEPNQRQSKENKSTKECADKTKADEVEIKFKVGDIINKKHNSDINKFGQFTITNITSGKYWYNNRIICDITEQDEWELYEPLRQNPTWSEEDETKLKSTCALIRNTSLKDNEGIAEKNIAWLESLKDKVQPQPKQEWSEEDEKMRNNLIELLIGLSANTRTDSTSLNYSYPREVNWLESLKDRYTWKPSKEQIDCFEHFVCFLAKSGTISTYDDNNAKVLYSLLHKLKTL